MAVTLPFAAWLGQFQVALDNSNAPGSMLALGEGAKADLSEKFDAPDASVMNQQSYRAIGGLQDFDISSDSYWDEADTGTQAILNSMGLLPNTAQSRLWLRIFENATNYSQIACYLSELGINCDDAGSLAKLSAKYAFDGTPGVIGGTTAYTTATNGAPLALAAANAPNISYKSLVSINTIGTSTAVVAATCSQIGSTASWQITTAAHRVIDPTVTFTWKTTHDSTGVAAANIQNVDCLFGVVTYTAAYHTSGYDVGTTFTGNYLTMNQILWAKKASATLTFDMLDITSLNNSSGFKMRVPGRRNFKASLTINDSFASEPQISGTGGIGTMTWRQIWSNRQPVVFELDPDGLQQQVVRAFVLLPQQKSPVDPAGLINQDIDLQLASYTQANLPLANVNSGFSMGAP